MDLQKDSLFASEGFIGDENYIWYLANELSAVIQVERKTGIATVLFVVKEYFEELAFRSIVKYMDRIYLFPFKGEQYVEYDINSGLYILKTIPCELKNKNWSAQYYQEGADVYFFYQSPCIVKYNFEQDKWVIFDKWNLEHKEEMFADESKHWFGQGAFKKDNQLFIQLNHDNRIACLNIDLGEIKAVDINLPPKFRHSYVETMICNEDILWLIIHYSDEDSKLVKCKVSQWDDYTEICSIPNDGRDTPYSLIVLCKSNVWILPGQYDKAWRISKENLNIEEIVEMPVIDKKHLKPVWGYNYNYGVGKMIDNSYIVINSRLRKIVEIDTIRDIFTEYEIKPVEMNRVWELGNAKLVLENKYFGLSDFITHNCIQWENE